MWDISAVMSSSQEEVERFLHRGYEPFAVTSNDNGERIWLKKFISTKEELKDAKIHSKQGQSDKGRGRRSASKPKE